MGDITRRKFLKGTGASILTGAVVSTVGLSGGTTPLKTVVPKATALNVLSPKARAYKHYLKSIKGMATMTALEIEANKNPTGTDLVQLEKRVQKTARKEYKDLTKVWNSDERKRTGVKSVARNSFESAINRKRSGAGQTTNAYSDHIAHQTEYRSSIGRAFGNEKMKDKWRGKKAVQEFNKSVSETSKDLHSTARTTLAIEKTIARRKKQKMKIKSKGAKVGGGGKMALPGLESAKNPTGMSLLTRRSLLM